MCKLLVLYYNMPVTFISVAVVHSNYIQKLYKVYMPLLKYMQLCTYICVYIYLCSNIIMYVPLLHAYACLCLCLSLHVCVSIVHITIHVGKQLLLLSS